MPLGSKEINKARDAVDRDLGTGNKNYLLKHTKPQREPVRGPFWLYKRQLENLRMKGTCSIESFWKKRERF